MGYLVEVVLGCRATWKRLAWVGRLPGGDSPGLVGFLEMVAWVGGLPGEGSLGLVGYLEEVVLGCWVTWRR